MNRQEQMLQIMKMESAYEELEPLITAARNDMELLEKALPLLCELNSYYENGEWMRDFDDDQKGLLPSDLKRGILCEDTIYDLLMDYSELLQQLKRILKKGALFE
ncbi:MAG: DUF4298 domain-containing protein [Eubacteriales bacterium]|nr:DUF4298 domain-containing protein [Eubacteriales bacterium]